MTTTTTTEACEACGAAPNLCGCLLCEICGDVLPDAGLCCACDTITCDTCAVLVKQGHDYVWTCITCVDTAAAAAADG